MRGIVATIIAAGALFLLAGCGGDDAPLTSVTTESSATTTEEPSADFATAADARCAEAYAAIANLTSETSASQELAITEGLLDGLQDLDPPEDPALDSFFAALEDQIGTLEEIEAAVASGDTTSVATLETELETERSSALAAANEYGLDDCGQAGTDLPDDPSTGEPVTPAPSATTPAAPVTPTTTTPVEPVPTEPAPAPVTPPATGGGTGTGSAGGSTGSTGGTSSGGTGGGISP